MPNSATATRFKPGTRWSRVAAFALSQVAVGSVDVGTIAHGLSKSPTHVTVTIRSVISAISGGCPTPVVTSWNASIVNVALVGENGGATPSGSIQFDVVMEVEHSFVS